MVRLHVVQQPRAVLKMKTLKGQSQYIFPAGLSFMSRNKTARKKRQKKIYFLNKQIDCKVSRASLYCFSVPYRHSGGRSKKINAWYLNTLMVYL
jgi:hypothetical protein